jgi:hypothetical protein
MIIEKRAIFYSTPEASHSYFKLYNRGVDSPVEEEKKKEEEFIKEEEFKV